MGKIPDEDIKKVIRQIIEWVDDGNAEMVAKFMLHLKEEYVELATLATRGEYGRSWTHKQILDFVTNS